MALVYLGLGTNLGEKEQNLTKAIGFLSSKVGRLVRQSAFYSSKPWGFESENEFLNAVILIETEWLPFELLEKTQEIEQQLGRLVKTGKQYADRIIDIDILIYDHLQLDEPELKIPHPYMMERDFVRIPLLEIAPEILKSIVNDERE